jgi:hypothetical protein
MLGVHRDEALPREHAFGKLLNLIEEGDEVLVGATFQLATNLVRQNVL